MDAKITKKLTKEDACDWAITVLREAVQTNSFGNISFSIQDGMIANAKREVNLKPAIDTDKQK